MSIYKKTLIVISITMVVFLTGIYFFSHLIIFKSFKDLEYQYVRTNLERVIASIDDELFNLYRSIHDWAAWDDSYEFIKGRYNKYIDVNLTDSTFINLNLNVILFLDKNWHVRYARAFDLINKRTAPFPESLYRYLKTLRKLNIKDSVHKGTYGIINLDEGLAMIALHPIIDSKETRPSEGMLVFCRFLNNEWIRYISKKTFLDVSVRVLEVNKEVFGVMKTSNFYIRTIDENYIEGSKIINDIYGDNIVLIKVLLDREIYKHSKAVIRYVIITFLVLGSASTVIVLVLLKKIVLKRLKKITDGIIDIRKSGNISLRLEVDGEDEISLLSGEINRMLQSQEEAEKILHAYSLTDDLTGIYNRRGFTTLASQQIKIADRSRKEMFLIFADVDNLKEINDRFGHLEGDRALIDVAKIMKETFRESDIIARIGGDEFVALTTETDGMDAEGIVSRLLENIKRFNDTQQRNYVLSMSVGVAKYSPDEPCTIDELISKADRMMYERKKGE